mmetsp:Transcript_4516/g.6628  ORF Transcript_4516/g.6628 Transcript_4516/m.6628 type:complete len:134 (-) Transcript_4516:782-1183(-)
MAALEEVVAELQDQRLVGCFAHPSVPRLVSVDHLGQVSVTCAHTGAIVGGGGVDLRPDGCAGAALMRGRAPCPEGGAVVAVGRFGAIGVWDLKQQAHVAMRTLRGDKLKDRAVSLVAGTHFSGGDALVFLARR